MRQLLHTLWHLPLGSSRRRGIAFGFAASVLIGAALLLAQQQPSTSPPRDAPRPSQARERPAPSPVGEQPTPPAADAKIIARRFVGAYLRVTYDNAAVSTLSPYATRGLVAELANEPARQPPAAPRRSRPKLQALTTGEGSREDHVTLSALVKDSHNTYTLLLTLDANTGRWLVTTLEQP